MENRCKNCGGLLIYDISSGKIKCESCESLFEPGDIAADSKADEYAENAKYDMSIFTCPNCGGEVASNELEAVEYCLYCGSFVTLDSQIRSIRKPDSILPFMKSKEECKKSFASMMRRKLYAPKEFRDDTFLEGFKGIYIPYWSYKYEYGPTVELRGLDEERDGDYIHKQYYNINCEAEGEIEGISYDASSSFDDDISSKIIPFDHRQLKPFNESYMYGFFADTADIDASLYQSDADEIAHDEIWDEITRDSEIKKGHPKRSESDKKFDENAHIKRSSSLAMLPVWFLTWRKDERVAYSVMNGNNGEIYSEVPIDIKRYMLFSLIIALPIFLLLNSAITFSAVSMLKISIWLSVLMILLYTSQLDKIIRKTMHADDRGYLEKHKDAKKEAEDIGGNGVSLVFGLIKDLIVGAFKEMSFWGIIVAIAAVGALSGYIVWGAIILVLAIVIYTIYRIAKDIKILKDYTVYRDLAGTFVALIAGIVLLICDPAGDEFYYFAAIVCAVGVGLTAIFNMKRNNELVTRPLPHFFERKAGGKS